MKKMMTATLKQLLPLVDILDLPLHKVIESMGSLEGLSVLVYEWRIRNG